MYMYVQMYCIAPCIYIESPDGHSQGHIRSHWPDHNSLCGYGHHGGLGGDRGCSRTQLLLWISSDILYILYT